MYDSMSGCWPGHHEMKGDDSLCSFGNIDFWTNTLIDAHCKPDFIPDARASDPTDKFRPESEFALLEFDACSTSRPSDSSIA